MPGSEIFRPKNYEILTEMGPYGSVGAHIKTGRSPMAQDHFETPPDLKKGHGMTKNPQKSKKSSRVGQGEGERERESERKRERKRETHPQLHVYSDASRNI